MTPEEFAASVLSDVIAEGITALLSYDSDTARTEPRHRDTLIAAIRQDQPILDLLHQGVGTAIRALPELRDSRDLPEFLSSGYVVLIVRQLFACQIVEHGGTYTGQVYEEFRSALSVHLGDKERADSVARPLFDSIVAGCARALTRSLEKGALGSHEALSSFRHRIVVAQLASIQKPPRPYKRTVRVFKIDSISLPSTDRK